ncbi:transcription elongation factor GreB [Panacagrimonas perspica]|uniref:Transcription elongation factor GreB n=1 Tax=Panacagrimonas perspica TaxID=381431 RepID=A0A4R7PA43_9GAMM|nr:transcription elongation factor GreB [Panacagrimonas perspica]TDU30758.1 transcription elongation factor GreB [Panacagrimonas perspica]THD01694.1 transcription elongation factor GreB [Panacagrimonas perspica]
MARGWGKEEDFEDAEDGSERFREAPAKASPYVTTEGYARLKAEYEELWSVRRPETVRALTAAAAEGDRSENAEYQYRKKELREIDRRVRYLQKRIPDLKVAGQKPARPERVYFGAVVELAPEQGDPKTYRIVGPDETDATQGRISIDSPLARALLNHEVGDVVLAKLPGGAIEFEILSVGYP